ncbi:MAG: hypothetical protein KAH46_30560, partial [Mycobacterium sp.]|nr:hypothetical protein [Mycobacterium sp.]
VSLDVLSVPVGMIEGAAAVVTFCCLACRLLEVFADFRPVLMTSANCWTEGEALTAPVAPTVTPTAASTDMQATAARRRRVFETDIGLPVCL